MKLFLNCGVGLVVEHVLAKDETGVRFSYAAQKIVSFSFSLIDKDLMEGLEKRCVNVDNYVGNVYKGHI